MEPDEIATLSLSMCLDLAITPPLEEGGRSCGCGLTATKYVTPTTVTPLPLIL